MCLHSPEDGCGSAGRLRSLGPRAKVASPAPPLWPEAGPTPEPCRWSGLACRSAGPVRRPNRPARRSPSGGAASRSCSIDVRCAPTAAPPSMRRSTSIGKVTPSFSAITCASTIIARATARVPGSVQSTSSVAWVRAEIGLKDRLPHSFTQISSRRRGRTGAFSPAAVRAFGQAQRRGRISRPKVRPAKSGCPRHG